MADLVLTRQNKLLTIRLNRPDKKNAMTDAMYHAFATALMEADRDDAIASVVIEAAGTDFCAGNDIGTLRAMAAGEVLLGDLHTVEFLDAIRDFGKPLLAAVTGRAIGVGATMLLHCDMVFAAHDAWLRFPFADMGLVPEAGSAYFLPARIGYARAYRLLCLSDPISGEEAAAIGLITGSYAACDVAAQTRAAAERLAVKSGDALRATKLLMRDQAAIEAAMQADQAAFIARLKAPEVLALLKK